MARKTLIETTNHQSGTVISILEIRGEKPETFWQFVRRNGAREVTQDFTDFSQVETHYFKQALELLEQIKLEDE